MDNYKDFLQQLRRIALNDHHLVLGDAITPKLKEYIKALLKVKSEDGFYHTYYGEIKRVITSFVNYMFRTTDEVVKEADRHSQIATRQELMDLAQKTLNINNSLQIDFNNDYLSVTSPEERKNYEEISELNNKYIEQIHELRNEIEKFDKQDKIEAFIKDHFKVTIKKTCEIFEFTHAYLSMMLADHVTEIRISLEEIHLRMRNNLRQLQQSANRNMASLINQLYENNKEYMQITRRVRRNSTEQVEAARGIEKTRKKIEKYEPNIYLLRVKEEVNYWERRLQEFEPIALNLTVLKEEYDNCEEQEKIYYKMRSTELPGHKSQCWETVGENFKQRKEYLKQKYKEESKALISFFCVRGTDGILYKNDIGSFLVDELNHQVYHFDIGMDICHVSCDGTFWQVSDKDKYFYDENGRYIIENGQKLYQSLPCGSKYKLDGDTLFEKVTNDCGHSELGNENCKMGIKELDDSEILPTVDPLDITKTLNSETVKYLWDFFGSILPEALHDVGISKPNNPIHFLAHKLLDHKYSRNLGQLREKVKEAEEFKTKIYQERREKAIAANKAWKSKQVKRRKPEESDDALHWAALNEYNTQNEFIISQDHFYT